MVTLYRNDLVESNNIAIRRAAKRNFKIIGNNNNNQIYNALNSGLSINRQVPPWDANTNDKISDIRDSLIKHWYDKLLALISNFDIRYAIPRINILIIAALTTATAYIIFTNSAILAALASTMFAVLAVAAVFVLALFVVPFITNYLFKPYKISFREQNFNLECDSLLIEQLNIDKSQLTKLKKSYNDGLQDLASQTVSALSMVCEQQLSDDHFTNERLGNTRNNLILNLDELKSDLSLVAEPDTNSKIIHTIDVSGVTLFSGVYLKEIPISLSFSSVWDKQNKKFTLYSITIGAHSKEVESLFRDIILNGIDIKLNEYQLFDMELNRSNKGSLITESFDSIIHQDGQSLFDSKSLPPSFSLQHKFIDKFDPELDDSPHSSSPGPFH